MKSLAIVILAAAAASAQVPAANLTRIGAAAAVRGAVKAQAPGAAVGRMLESGKPLYLNDHVTTDAAGRLQILLLDQTAFTIGPNSDLVLDEFVYDPATDAGKVTANVTKGVFRFVTGKVARKDPGSMRVKLPVGTIGIRGTIAAGQASESGSTIILLGPGSHNNADENPGAVAVSNAGQEVTITQPGFGTTILPGQPPAGVMYMSQQAQQLLGLLSEAPQGPGQSAAGSSGAQSAQQSGQATAQGGISAMQSGEAAALTQQLNTDAQNAAQESAKSVFANGLSSWSEVRTVQSGIGSINGAGNYTCSGTLLCSSGGSGSFNYNINVDFGARAISGGSIGIVAGGTLPGDSASISSIDFSALSGDASISLQPAQLNNSFFTGTTLSFMNRDGVAAKDMKVDLNYDTTSDAAVGSSTTEISSLPQ